MSFPERLATLRKERNLSRKALADAVGIHVTQMGRYEAGTSQPTLDVIRKLAQVLHVSADTLVFDEGERSPADELKPHFAAVAKLSEEERRMVKAVIEGLLLKHEASRWSQAG